MTDKGCIWRFLCITAKLTGSGELTSDFSFNSSLFYISLVPKFGGASRLYGEVMKIQVLVPAFLPTDLRVLITVLRPFYRSLDTEYGNLYYPKLR